MLRTPIQTALTALNNASDHASQTNHSNVIYVPNTVTENGQPAHLSTRSSLLDFFVSSVRGKDETSFLLNLQAALEEDPIFTIGMLFQLRDVRGGKGEKLLTLYALTWLREHKPKTYLLNLSQFIEYGYFKDLCQLTKIAHTRNMDKLGATTYIELELMASCLKDDYAAYQTRDQSEENKAKTKVRLSLCPKWAPTPNTHFDKKENGNQAKHLARLMFNTRTSEKDYRVMLSTLRNELRIVEKLMAENRWEEIDFGAVPSKAHLLLRKAFGKHQEARYLEYKSKLATGEAKINTTGTEPHQLVEHYLGGKAFDQIIDSQWATIVNKLMASGVLSKALAIVDVSGSMSGTPMTVAIALGLIVAELTGPPFNGKCITFSASPKMFDIVGQNLQEKVNSLKHMEWGMNTNLMAVFDLILHNAMTNNLAPEKLIETLFIFTDMQFDQAESTRSKGWADTFTVIKDKYNKAGYKVPQIVFWNLRATANAFPTTADQEGVALVSGFSPELLKVFMEGGDFSPMAVLRRAIAPYLEKVVVNDQEFNLGG